jgi:DNA-binding response OmpR family regulator
MRLLLVEDDSMIGEAARQGLRHEGHTVDALALDANYIRRCDAELFTKGKSFHAK